MRVDDKLETRAGSNIVNDGRDFSKPLETVQKLGSTGAGLSS